MQVGLTQAKELNKVRPFIDNEGNVITYEQRDMSSTPGKACIKTFILTFNGREPDQRETTKAIKAIKGL